MTSTDRHLTLGAIGGFADVVADAPSIRAAIELATCVVDAPTPVLLAGPTGTGKDVFAHAIHAQSRRHGAAFVALNCGALTDTLLESELFGHRRGSFSGAITDARGLFRLADGGTLFLDEIGEASPALQVHLLRVLEDGCIRAVGDERTHAVDVRIIAATNRNLETEVSAGRFRPDLYARLAVFPIELPSLEDRREDIPSLTRYFLDLHALRLGRRAALSASAMQDLLARSYPGNVRDLRNLLERAVLLARDGVIHPEHLAPGRPAPQPRGVEAPAGVVPVASHGVEPLETRLQRFERAQIVAALERHRGNRRATALELCISTRWLLKKMQRYGLGRQTLPLAA